MKKHNRYLVTLKGFDKEIGAAFNVVDLENDEVILDGVTRKYAKAKAKYMNSGRK